MTGFPEPLEVSWLALLDTVASGSAVLAVVGWVEEDIILTVGLEENECGKMSIILHHGTR